MKRPLMALLGMFLLGLATGQFGYLHIGYILAAAAAATGIIGRSISLLATKKQVYGMLLLLLFLSGAVWGYLDRRERDRSQQEALALTGEVTISGTVREVRKEGLIVDTESGRALVRVEDAVVSAGDSVEGKKSMDGKGTTEGEKSTDGKGTTEDGKSPGGGNYPVDEILAGDGVRITGEIAELSESVNPGSFDAKSYYESEGVLFCFYASEIVREEAGDFIITQLLARIRRTAEEHIREILPDREAGVLSAMLLGEKSGMDAELKSLYQKSGIAHILAISGLHISLLGGALLWLLILVGVSRRAASVLSILFLLLYGALVGFPPVALRAILMFTSVALASVFRRVSDMPTAMTASLFLILILQPWRLTSSGIVFSFLAVSGVVCQDVLYRDVFGKERFLLVPLKLRRVVKGLVGSLLVSLLVQLFLLPVMLRDYYYITPYSPLLNLLVIPLLTIAVGSGALGLLVSFIPGCTGAASVVVMPCRWILRFYEWLCEVSSGLPGQQIVTGHISTEEMLGMILLCFGLVWTLHLWITRRNRKKRPHGKTVHFAAVIAALLSFSALFSVYAGLMNRFRECAVFFSVGQGDGCLLHTWDADILFDFGSSSKQNLGENVLLPGLLYYGIDYVDLAVISHTDTDHISGIAELLEQSGSSGVEIGAIAFAAGTERDGNYDRLVSAAKEAGTEVVFLKEGDCVSAGESSEAGNDISTGEGSASGDDISVEESDSSETDQSTAEGVLLEVLYPASKGSGSGNEYSLVIRAEVHGTSFLFTGDIGEETEAALVSSLKQAGGVDVLKVPHHGSKYSSSSVFLEAAGKENSIAVISCGRNNMYGHPAKDTIDRLEASGFTIYRTDRQGAVTLELP